MRLSQSAIDLFVFPPTSIGVGNLWPFVSFEPMVSFSTLERNDPANLNLSPDG